MSEHFITICECGDTISQCRCIGNDKVVKVITHLEHEKSLGLLRRAESAEGVIEDLKYIKVESPIKERIDIGIPLVLDYDDMSLDHIMGYMVPESVNPSAKAIYNLFKQGYTFTVAPTLSNIVYSKEEPNKIISCELESLSIITVSGRKRPIV